MIWAELKSQGNEDWCLKFDTHRRSVFSIGRHPSSQLNLSDMHISSKHLSIAQRVSVEGLREVIVIDCSSNGTWIDGERLEKGAEVRLLNGSEITFPCEEELRKMYSFQFNVLIDPNEPVDGGFGRDNSNPESSQSDDGNNGSYKPSMSLASSPLSSEEASYAHREQQHSFEQWQELEKLQEKLTIETARLVASIYENDKVIGALSLNSSENNNKENVDNDNVSPSSASASASDSDRLNTTVTVDEDEKQEQETQNDEASSSGTTDLYITNQNLLGILEQMMESIKTASDMVSSSETTSNVEKQQILETLQVEKYSEVCRLLETKGNE